MHSKHSIPPVSVLLCITKKVSALRINYPGQTGGLPHKLTASSLLVISVFPRLSIPGSPRRWYLALLFPSPARSFHFHQ